MFKRSVIIVLFGVFSATSSLYGQEINWEKSSVTFKIDNTLFNTVKGKFKGKSGEIIFDEKNLNEAKVNACIEAASINTKNKKRDNHLKNKDFFEVEKYPDICFVSEKISKTDDGFTAIGELNLHGITKKIAIPFTNSGNEYSGSFKINRFDFDLGKDTGTFLVGETARITINCVTD